METITLCENAVIGASGRLTSQPVNMQNLEGYMAIGAKIAGNGTARIFYEVSQDGHAWATPEGALDVLSTITKTSGSGANGLVSAQFNPVLAPWLRLVLTETGGASPVLATVRLTVQ